MECYCKASGALDPPIIYSLPWWTQGIIKLKCAPRRRRAHYTLRCCCVITNTRVWVCAGRTCSLPLLAAPEGGCDRVIAIWWQSLACYLRSAVLSFSFNPSRRSQRWCWQKVHRNNFAYNEVGSCSPGGAAAAVSHSARSPLSYLF